MIKLIVSLLLLVIQSAHAADYYVYKDAEGKITISNKQLPLPVIKHYDWQDATDAEIAAVQRANRDELILNKYLHPDPAPQSQIITTIDSSGYYNSWSAHGHNWGNNSSSRGSFRGSRNFRR